MDAVPPILCFILKTWKATKSVRKKKVPLNLIFPKRDQRPWWKDLGISGWSKPYILPTAETKWGFKSVGACSCTACALFNDVPPDFAPMFNDRVWFRRREQLAGTSGRSIMELLNMCCSFTMLKMKNLTIRVGFLLDLWFPPILRNIVSWLANLWTILGNK